MSSHFSVVIFSEMIGRNYPTTMTKRKNVFLTPSKNVIRLYIIAVKYLVTVLRWSGAP